MLIVADKIDYDAQNPNLKLQWAASDNNRSSSALLDTCTVQWAREDINLKAGDRYAHRFFNQSIDDQVLNLKFI